MLLKGFADSQSRVAVTNRSGATFVTHLNNASVRNNFYSFEGISGKPDDAVEVWLGARAEAPAAPVLEHARVGIPPCPYDPDPIAWFIATSLCRSPYIRRMMHEFDSNLKPEVTAATFERYRTRGIYFHPQVIDFVTNLPIDHAETTRSQLRTMASIINETQSRLRNYEWSVATSDSAMLITSDSSVAVERPADHWQGIVPLGSSVFMPASPHHLIIGESRRIGAMRRPLTDDVAGWVNSTLSRSAESEIYYHPTMPVPQEAALDTQAPATPIIAGSVSTRSRESVRTPSHAEPSRVADITRKLNAADTALHASRTRWRE
ncbi:DUF4238 domain-containing protein [Flavimobilis sp. GY10621]|uniref:DUF4238 domain-containing protein n=1 Tax=Flavimobilis rhizosphaerae TaxID=2775421 RepID=A0ABR9DQZ7_9MICO|nr:DUF4238 domain-containing protein [Flavimobilis rhizosphaerae]